MYCTVAQVRASNKKLTNETEILTADIEDRIAESEDVVEIDLSPLMTEAEISALGSSAKVINLMTLYKTIEKCLVYYYGATRNIKDISDIQYYQDMYNDLLKKVLNGEIKIEESGTEYGAPSYPKSTSSTHNLKIYPRKGVEGFQNNGMDDDYKDDRFDS